MEGSSSILDGQVSFVGRSVSSSWQVLRAFDHMCSRTNFMTTTTTFVSMYYVIRLLTEGFVLIIAGSSQSSRARPTCSTSTPRRRGHGCQPRRLPWTCHSFTTRRELSIGSFQWKERRLSSTRQLPQTWHLPRHRRSSDSGQMCVPTRSTASDSTRKLNSTRWIIGYFSHFCAQKLVT